MFEKFSLRDASIGSNVRGTDGKGRAVLTVFTWMIGLYSQ